MTTNDNRVDSANNLGKGSAGRRGDFIAAVWPSVTPGRKEAGFLGRAFHAGIVCSAVGAGRCCDGAVSGRQVIDGA